REQRYAGDEIGQLRLHLPQESVVGKGVSRISRYGATESREQVLEIADMIVDLGRQDAGIIESALLRSRAGILPLAPEARADERQKGRNRGQHERQQLSPDAAQQRHLPPRWSPA